MDFIITDSERRELGFIDRASSLDIDIGVTNDFELIIKLDDYSASMYSPKNFIICPNTEYGGILDDPEVVTSEKAVYFYGDTFRGLLYKKCIEPPKGQDYKIISGELNKCISQLVNEHFNDMFTVSEENTGVNLTNYKFNRYVTLGDGIDSMLASVGYRLDINIVLGDEFAVQLSAKPVTDYSDNIEFSQDGNIQFDIKKVTNRYDYMICLGKGELKDRTIIYLYQNAKGKISKVSSIPKGDDVRVYIYDNNNSENEETLIADATKKFAEINKCDSQKLTVNDNVNLELGDIVGGRDYITGLTIAQPVTDKIVKYEKNKLSISYEIGKS